MSWYRNAVWFVKGLREYTRYKQAAHRRRARRGGRRGQAGGVSVPPRAFNQLEVLGFFLFFFYYIFLMAASPPPPERTDFDAASVRAGPAALHGPAPGPLRPRLRRQAGGLLSARVRAAWVVAVGWGYDPRGSATGAVRDLSHEYGE